MITQSIIFANPNVFASENPVLAPLRGDMKADSSEYFGLTGRFSIESSLTTMWLIITLALVYGG